MSECEKCGGNQYIRLSDQSIELCECVTDDAHDPVARPDYYNKGGIQCIDAVEAAVCNLTGIEAHATASALQYLWRWREKNGAEDLEKAKWFLDFLLDRSAENSD